MPHEENEEAEGPHEWIGHHGPTSGKWRRKNELCFDSFCLGSNKYYWHHIPNPAGKIPRDPSLDYDLGDRYDKHPEMYKAEAKYDVEIEK